MIVAVVPSNFVFSLVNGPLFLTLIAWFGDPVRTGGLSPPSSLVAEGGDCSIELRNLDVERLSVAVGPIVHSC